MKAYFLNKSIFTFCLFVASVFVSNAQIKSYDIIPYRKGDKWGYCDRNKKLIVECKYEYASVFIENTAIVKYNGKYGFIDKTGKEIVPPKYDKIYVFFF